MNRYWIGVVSRSHVLRGVEGGFAQLSHGKRAPLAKMHEGDGLIYYSPRTAFPDGEPLQAFTAIGWLLEDEIDQVEMSPDFKPFRRNIAYLPSVEAPIHPLLPVLSFTQQNRNWGMLVRRGHFEIPEADFRQIAGAMQAAITR